MFSKDGYDVFRVESSARDETIAKAFNEGTSRICKFKNGIKDFLVTAYKDLTGQNSFVIEPSNPKDFDIDFTVRYVIRNNESNHCAVMSKTGMTGSSAFINLSRAIIKYVSLRYISEMKTAGDAVKCHLNLQLDNITYHEIKLYSEEHKITDVIHEIYSSKGSTDKFCKEYLNIIIKNHQISSLSKEARSFMYGIPKGILKQLSPDVKRIVVESKDADAYFNFLKNIEEKRDESMEDVIAACASTSSRYCKHFELDFDSFYKGKIERNTGDGLTDYLHRLGFYKENDIELFEQLKVERNYFGLARYFTIVKLLKEEIIAIFEELDPTKAIDMPGIGTINARYVINVLKAQSDKND